VGFRNLWTLNPRFHSRLESFAGKEARAGRLLPDPDPEWSRMLPVVPAEEDARHVLFECVRFVEDRTALETGTGVSTSPSTLVPTMLRGQMEWDATAKFAASVMRTLRIADKEREEVWTRKLPRLCEALLCGRTAQILQFTPIYFSKCIFLVVVIK